MLKNSDNDLTKLEKENEKSKEALVNQMVENKKIRQLTKQEIEMQNKYKQMISDFEKKLENKS